MTFRSILKSAAIGAGICIFAVGLALAQTTPPPVPSPAPAAPQVAPPPVSAPSSSPVHRVIRDACRDRIDAALRGPERREAMRKCRIEARQSLREERRAQRESRKDLRKTCRFELKDQRFTEDERKAAIQECIAKKDPKLGKQLACRKEAQDRKLEPRTPELRSFMRECIARP